MKSRLMGVLLMIMAGVFSLSGNSFAGVKDNELPRPANAQFDMASGRRSPAVKFKEGELLVKFKPGVLDNSKDALYRKHGSTKIKEFRSLRLHHLKLKKGQSVEEAIKHYKSDPDVEYAEPNFVYEAQLMPNDPSFGSLWGLHNTGQTGGTADVDINAPEAWSITTGSPDTIVAVIDTGVDYTHQDLAANIWVNPGEIPGNGIDDDGNGYVDDVHGINAISNSGDPMDDAGHGTHVSGTIAAQGNNNLGVVGVNWSAKIIACKFLDNTGFGSTSDALKCLDYLYDLTIRQTNPVNIILSNNSWGGGENSQALHDAIDLQRQAGMLFIASAGNSGWDTDTFPDYPSGYDLLNIISVAATDSTDNLASFSNYGQHAVHVAAPGVGILSTLPTNSYGTYSGTSMAAPQVSGLAALLKSQDPSRDWKTIKNLILAGGQDIPAADGTTVTGKRVRAADSNGVGSLTCSNQIVFRRMKPAVSITYTGAGLPVGLSALNISCSAPNGSVVVSTSTGTQLLADDGQGTDQEAGDGIYSGQWTPPGTGDHTMTFPGNDQVLVRVVPNYAPAEETTYTYRTISGIQVFFTTGPTATILSPFPIHFAGLSDGYQALTVSYYSGNMSFTDNGVYEWNNTPFPTSLQTQISPYWDNLDFSYGGGIYWDVLGSAPDRELVVEYRDVHHYEYPSGKATFQTVFFENSSDILFNYKDVVFGNLLFDAGASATVGIQTAPNLARQFSYNTASLRDGMALLWHVEEVAADTLPDQFILFDRTDVAVNSVIASNSVSITGITASVQVTITGGEFELNNSGVWSSMTGTASNNDTIRVRLVSSPSYAAMKSATLTIGGVSATFNVTTIPPPPVSTVTLVASPAVKQVVGQPVRFTAEASGGSDSFRYQFRLKTGTTWTTPQGWGPSNIFDWTSSQTGTYTIQVRARNAESAAGYDVLRNITFTVVQDDPVKAVSLVSLQKSPQAVGTQIEFDATATGTTNDYVYQYWVKTGTTRAMVQDYTALNSSHFTWDTSGLAPAIYSVRVWAKNADSLAPYEAVKSVNFTIVQDAPVTAVSLAVIQKSPQDAGTQVEFNATATGTTNDYVYQYWVKTGASWAMVQDYTATNSSHLTWDTTNLSPGIYTMQVRAKNAGSIAAYEAVKSRSYEIR